MFSSSLLPLLDLSFVIGTPLYLHFLKSFPGSALWHFLFTLLLLDFLAHKGQWLLARPLCHELPNGKGQLLHIDGAQNTMHASNGFANLLFARFQMRPRFFYSYKFLQPSPNFGLKIVKADVYLSIYQRCIISPVHLKLVKILQTFREWADERRSQCLEIVMERRAWNDQFVSVPAATDQLPDWPQTFLMVRYSALPAIEDSTNWPMVNDHLVDKVDNAILSVLIQCLRFDVLST